MLDSLVRVSRRVGGAADLLATEMRAVPTRTLAVRARSVTRRVRSQERGAPGKPRTSPTPSVQSQRFVAWRAGEMQPADREDAAARLCRSHAQRPTARKPEPPAPTSRTPPFTTTQFHVLLNSLFKVLFNFPSRYLFAIGLGVIFSLTWSLPRALSCTPKQLDSGEKVSAARRAALRAYHPLRAVAPVKVDLDRPPSCEKTLPNTTFRATERAGGSVLGSARFIRHY